MSLTASKQTVKAANSRLARFETKKVYSYAVTLSHKVTKIAGVTKIGA